jgi:vacuolar-type H+-ATPase subunit I/STV1
MSGTENFRGASSVWIPWVAALLGFGFQIIWFSSQFGSLSARIEDAERRVALIEQNGSPVVQGLRTEVTINGRRISTLEDLYNSKVSGVLTEVATHDERLKTMQADLNSLKEWQVDHIREDGAVDGRIATLDRQLQQLAAEHRALEQDVVSLSHSTSRH